MIELHDWQKDLLKQLEGKKPGEITIMMAGRQTGKSLFNAMWKRMYDDIYNRPVTDLILSEGRVHGAKYHCVQPEGGNWAAMEAWCKDTFGEPGEIWPKDDFAWPDSARWLQNNRKFWFRNEADRTLFVMKWR